MVETFDAGRLVDETEDITQIQLGEAQLEVLQSFLRDAIALHLVVDKDLINRELCTPEKIELLQTFAVNIKERSLVIAKIQKPNDGGVEISISTKVECLGTNAQIIAFLKREEFSQLDFDGNTNLPSQLQVVNLGYQGESSNLFELVSTYMNYSFMPLL